MIDALLTLLSCQLAGEVTVRALGLPLPGPVAGMALLFALLVLRSREGGAAPPPALATAADTLLGNLSILFVPAAVGVIRYGGMLRAQGFVMLAAVVVSTLLALIVTALVFDRVRRLSEPPR